MKLFVFNSITGLSSITNCPDCHRNKRGRCDRHLRRCPFVSRLSIRIDEVAWQNLGKGFRSERKWGHKALDVASNNRAAQRVQIPDCPYNLMTTNFWAPISKGTITPTVYRCVSCDIPSIFEVFTLVSELNISTSITQCMLKRQVATRIIMIKIAFKVWDQSST